MVLRIAHMRLPCRSIFTGSSYLGLGQGCLAARLLDGEGIEASYAKTEEPEEYRHAQLTKLTCELEEMRCMQAKISGSFHTQRAPT